MAPNMATITYGRLKGNALQQLALMPFQRLKVITVVHMHNKYLVVFSRIHFDFTLLYFDGTRVCSLAMQLKRGHIRSKQLSFRLTIFNIRVNAPLPTWPYF